MPLLSKIRRCIL